MSSGLGPGLCRLVAAFLLVLSLAARTSGQPNIVFILADDLGYGEVGCFGQERIPTPNIDRLAAMGCRLTCHYAGAPVCAPSRCVLLTGMHTGHAEIRGNRDSGEGGPFPGQWPLSGRAVTIARVLHTAGYRTGAFGKWGLGPRTSTGAPLNQGFGQFFGYICQRNAHSYYPEYLDRDDVFERINDVPVPGYMEQPDGPVLAETYRSDQYAPDLILHEALEFIDTHREEPFFLYLPLIEPHVAMHPPQPLVDRFPAEWDADREPYRGQNGYLPHPRPRAAYAAMISGLDDHVGAILDRLESNGLLEKTLIVFTSDNGPTHAGKDPAFHIGGVDCAFFRSTSGLRGFKGSCYEGGLRVPAIAVWPGRIGAGTTLESPTWFPDWFPTLAAAAKANIPANATLDGIDLGPALSGKAAVPERTMLWDFAEYGGIAAVRQGNWKAIRRDLNRPNPLEWELYDLVADPGESRDVAAENLPIVQQMEQAFIQGRTVEDDFPNRFYDPITGGQR